MFLVNVFQFLVIYAPNFESILIGRALSGLSSAGGSVTLGMVADMWHSDHQQYAVAFVVFSSVGGSVLGPVVGGFLQQYVDWQWTIWAQLFFGAFVQVAHLFFVPETRSTILMNKIARRRRESRKDPTVYGPSEGKRFWQLFSRKEILTTWIRPFKMFLTEPIVLTLSLLSGFSDALIFMFIQSFGLVYTQWGFNDYQVGLAFIPLLLGYFLAWGIMCFAVKRNIAERKLNKQSERVQYESRLKWLLWTAPCLPIGLIGFAWTISGPPIHWFGSMIFAAIVGLANFAIYGSTIDYMVCYRLLFRPIYITSVLLGTRASSLPLRSASFYLHRRASLKKKQSHTILYTLSSSIASCTYSEDASSSHRRLSKSQTLAFNL